MMSSTYKSKEIVKAEGIWQQTKKLNIHNPGVFPYLESLIDEYNELSELIGDSKVMPRVERFSYSVDVQNDGMIDHISSAGTKKFLLIASKCREYVETHIPIPQQVVKIEGWSSKKFWGLTSFVVALCGAVCFGLYQIGKDIGFNTAVSECQEGKSELKAQNGVLIDSLRMMNSMVQTANDSLESCVVRKAKCE